MSRAEGKKMLDKGGVGSYPTASMSSPGSPEMLIRAADPVQIWTERGDLTNAGQEEGRSQEGRNEEEEVGAPGFSGKGGWTDHLPVLFYGL